MSSPTSQLPTGALYHATGESAFSAIGAIAITLGAWATFLVPGALLVRAGISPLGAIAVAELAMLAVVVLAVRVGRRDRRALGLTWPRRRYLIAGALVGISMWLINLAVVALLSLPSDPRGGQVIANPPFGLVFAALVILPAVCEEVVFRGLLLRGLATRFVGWVAVAGSALVFSLYHLSVPQLAPTLILGIVFGAITLRSGSIVPTIIAHAINNTIVTLIVRGELPWLTDLVTSSPTVALPIAAVLSVAGIAIAMIPEVRDE